MWVELYLDVELIVPKWGGHQLHCEVSTGTCWLCLHRGEILDGIYWLFHHCGEILDWTYWLCHHCSEVPSETYWLWKRNGCIPCGTCRICLWNVGYRDWIWVHLKKMLIKRFNKYFYWFIRFVQIHVSNTPGIWGKHLMGSVPFMNFLRAFFYKPIGQKSKRIRCICFYFFWSLKIWTYMYSMMWLKGHIWESIGDMFWLWRI